MTTVIILSTGVSLWCVLLYIRWQIIRKYAYREQRELERFKRELSTTMTTIIRVDYTEHRFKEINAILTKKQLERIIILLVAPDWLVAVKQRAWPRHLVVNARLYPTLLPYFQRVDVLVGTEKKVIRFSDAYEYLRTLNEESEEICS